MFKDHMLKRAGFMFLIMFPILLILEYTGNSSTAASAVLAAVTAGVSVIIFPDPEHIKKINQVKNEKSDK